MDKALAAEALEHYAKIERVRELMAEIQKPRQERAWSVRLMGRDASGIYNEAVSARAIQEIAIDDNLDTALTPLVLHQARLLMAMYGARLEKIGFKKPDGCP